MPFFARRCTPTAASKAAGGAPTHPRTHAPHARHAKATLQPRVPAHALRRARRHPRRAPFAQRRTFGLHGPLFGLPVRRLCLPGAYATQYQGPLAFRLPLAIPQAAAQLRRLCVSPTPCGAARPPLVSLIRFCRALSAPQATDLFLLPSDEGRPHPLAGPALRARKPFSSVAINTRASVLPLAYPLPTSARMTLLRALSTQPQAAALFAPACLACVSLVPLCAFACARAAGRRLVRACRPGCACPWPPLCAIPSVRAAAVKPSLSMICATAARRPARTQGKSASRGLRGRGLQGVTARGAQCHRQPAGATPPARACGSPRNRRCSRCRGPPGWRAPW